MQAVPETFSAELRSLVERMLDVDAKTRPSVHDVITTPYFKESLKTFEHLLSHTVAAKSSSTTPEVPAEPVSYFLLDTGSRVRNAGQPFRHWQGESASSITTRQSLQTTRSVTDANSTSDDDKEQKRRSGARTNRMDRRPSRAQGLHQQN